MCDCMTGFYFNNGVCLSESSKCDSIKYSTYNSLTKQCDCNSNYILKTGLCVLESSKCDGKLHFVFNPLSK